MKFTVILLLAAGALLAADPKPLSDADARKVREAQLAVSDRVGGQAQALAQYLQSEKAIEQAKASLNALLAKLKKDYDCADCELTESNLQWEKPQAKDAKK